MPVLMYHEGVLNQGVKYPKCKKVYHKVVVIQWICLLIECIGFDINSQQHGA